MARGAGWDIRIAGVDDAEPLAHLHRSAFAQSWDGETLAALMAAPGGLALVAADAGGTAGFILLRTAVDEGEILTLAVRPERRRGGCATALLRRALADVGRRGTRRMLLEVAEDNLAARALYTRAGFQPVGRRRGYYRNTDGGTVDALVLARLLAEELSPPSPACESSADVNLKRQRSDLRQ